MKKNYPIFSFIILTIALIVCSCSKDEDMMTPSPTPSPTPQTTIAYRYQLVSLDFPNQSLQSNYEATIGGQTIIAYRSDDHQLNFLVPPDIALGNQTLVIPGLNDFSQSFEVKETILDQSSEETINGLQNQLDSFGQTLDNSPLSINTQNNISQFNQIFANATDFEKAGFARFYKANKLLIDLTIANDFADIAGRTLEANVLLQKFKAAVLAAGLSVYGAYYAQPLYLRPIFATIAIVSAVKAIQFGRQYLDEKVNTINAVIDGDQGITNKGNLASLPLIFESDVSRTSSFNTLKRSTIASDSNSSQPSTSAFFQSYSTCNEMVGMLNSTIVWINENIESANMSTIDQLDAPSTTGTINIVADTESFSHFNFTINNPNLTITQKILQSTGQLVLEIKSTSNAPVSATLNYSYSDNYSACSGGFPILVNPQMVYTVGDAFGGGIIAYVDGTGQHGLIAAPFDVSTGSTWLEAFQVCNNYSGGGFTDWFLPNIQQLSTVYLNQAAIGGFNINCDETNFGECSYWTSEPNGSVYAWSQYFTTGILWSNYGAAGLCRVRAVRAF